ncbi:hypothetical protein JSQ81_05840 [Sporosarcina sp. Marseille-Q4063]|uniref:hypothetical protein n=1 Tax=Sporosarcina sp. Marseille-Q4063 TaxID=2810514 RepID=UPI001BAFC8C9|nr:hypothetical protein [Sporosarcina sp. Marseille-Q4063]QUW23088.1 hypothetical protein JSQ81_05840 [Sporosarcina sp. Marseille-Q4063]
MKKKVRLFIVIGLLFVVGMAGKVFLDNQEDREVTREQKVEAEIIEVERMSVVALKKTFANIKSIEFEQIHYNEMTGFYSMIVKMTNADEEFVVFDFMFITTRPNDIEGWGVINKEKVQIRGETKSKVNVIYTNGNVEEI